MYLDDIKEGLIVKLSGIVMDKDEMIGFSEKYNPAPLHTDEEYAKTTRFGQVIAPGMLTFLKVWNEYIPHDPAGEQFVAGLNTFVEWFAPVFAGDTLSAEAFVLEKRDKGNGTGFLYVKIYIYTQKDSEKPAAMAHIKSLVKCRNYETIREKRREKEKNAEK